MPEDSFASAVRLCNGISRNDLNEAETRNRIIDGILKDVLCWPHSATKLEKKSCAGYLDYLLIRPGKTERPLLVIEAKKAGEYFVLPRHCSDNRKIHTVQLKRLLSHTPIRKAVTQAKGYATDRGCLFAAITNGFEWIIFKAFEPSTNFDELFAKVIPSIETFVEAHTEVCNLLSFASIVESQSLTAEFSKHGGTSRPVDFPKKHVPAYDAPLNKNEYARYLEPIARLYLDDIPTENTSFMEKCYVIPQGMAGVTQELEDQLSPYFKNDGVKEIVSQHRLGDVFQRDLSEGLHQHYQPQVLILFGGKGAGKSTFLQRMFFHTPPKGIELHATPVVLNMLHCPQSEGDLTRYIWDLLAEKLDTDRMLNGSIEELVQLFEYRYDIASKQTLHGLPEDSIEFNTTRNSLIESWKSDKTYCTKELARVIRRNGRTPIVVLDNTDQLRGGLQDLCFLTAHQIAKEIQCIVVISMREERYCRAKSNGVLDAYHNTGYHLPSPSAGLVFQRRLEYILDLLDDHTDYTTTLNIPTNAPAEDLRRFFDIHIHEFQSSDGNLKRFIHESSQGNLRSALDLFARYISSGYTNVEEMLSRPHWTIAPHQVIKPMMIPERYKYDEDKSQIPNLFQLRNITGLSSHFTAIRILRHLTRTTATADHVYSEVYDILAYLDENFGMRRDGEACLDVLLKHRILEADNRLDTYEEFRLSGNGQDSEIIHPDRIRLTAYGRYFLDYLCKTFTYLELVSLDCAIADEATLNSLVYSATKERTTFDKLDRLDSRMQRVQAFLEYLEREEKYEMEVHLLDGIELPIVPGMREAFEQDRLQVLSSASRLRRDQ